MLDRIAVAPLAKLRRVGEHPITPAKPKGLAA
jgi:hypothetical protein